MITMRVLVDARMMGPENTRGIGRYLEECLRVLIASHPEDTWTLVTRSSDHPFAHEPQVQTVVADIPWYTWQEQIKLPRILSRYPSDVVYFPHWNVPLWFWRPFVVTIHDAILFHTPDSAHLSTRSTLVRWMKRFAHRVTVWSVMRRASCILVPTEYVRQDLSRLFSFASSRIMVTGEGMPTLTLDHVPPSSPVLLTVGSAYPHKGLDDLATAWPELRRQFPSLTWNVVGEMDTFMKRLQSRVEGMEGIVFRGRVTSQELDESYRTASALIFPSHEEGFGLPVLEAISHGLPVISSDAGPMVEVLGKEGAVFFRAGDSSGIISAVQAFFREEERWGKTVREIAPKLALRHAWTTAGERMYSAFLSATRTS